MIKNERVGNIVEIARYSDRIMEISPLTGIGGKILHILNTDAPHMRYEKGERNT